MDTPIPNTAILRDGSAVRLDKHDQQWLKHDAWHKENNQKLMETCPRGFVNEEIARLQEKGWEMSSRGIEAVEYRDKPPAGLSFGMRRLIQLSYNDAHKAASGSQWRTYVALWEWSGFYMSVSKQDVFWDKFGKEAFYRRVNKIRRACGFEEMVGVS